MLKTVEKKLPVPMPPVLQAGRDTSFQILPLTVGALRHGIESFTCRTIAIKRQVDLKNRMNRGTDTWRNGCFGNIDDPPVHPTPNHLPPKICRCSLTNISSNHPFPLNGYYSIQVCPPNQQRRPLPFLLSDTFYKAGIQLPRQKPLKQIRR